MEFDSGADGARLGVKLKLTININFNFILSTVLFYETDCAKYIIFICPSYIVSKNYAQIGI